MSDGCLLSSQPTSGASGRFPHIKRAGDFIFVSGTSARRADDSVAGATLAADGSVLLDIGVQTRAVIEHLRDILSSVGCDLQELVSVTSYLADMRDFSLYNRVYGEYFPRLGPTRTTIAVHQLPHPHLLIEMRATAYKPVK